jgi:hypothetical protein
MPVGGLLSQFLIAPSAGDLLDPLFLRCLELRSIDCRRRHDSHMPRLKFLSKIEQY